MERWKSAIVAALRQVPDAVGIYERSDSSVRQKEGIAHAHREVLSGMEPPERIRIREGELDYAVDIAADTRPVFTSTSAQTRFVLPRSAGEVPCFNCFSFTGAFGIAALAAGAERVLQVDSSESARIWPEEIPN